VKDSEHCDVIGGAISPQRRWEIMKWVVPISKDVFGSLPIRTPPIPWDIQPQGFAAIGDENILTSSTFEQDFSLGVEISQTFLIIIHRRLTSIFSWGIPNYLYESLLSEYLIRLLRTVLCLHHHPDMPRSNFGICCFNSLPNDASANTDTTGTGCAKKGI